MSRHIAALSGTAVLAAFAVVGIGRLAVGAPAGPASAPRGASLPPPPLPALAVPAPRGLGGSPHLTVWTILVRPTTARARPDADARPVARLRRRTPEGTPNSLVPLGRASDEHGHVWVRARLPVLPNGTTGWIRRRALGAYQRVRTHLVVDLDRLTATLLRHGRRVLRADVGVGQPRWPTPRGEFHIRNRLTGYRSPFYGPVAFGTSARSPQLTDWPAGGFVGIHGTDRPDLVPGRVSHGCIRMRNDDILRLARLMPVGTPVTIH
jgi:hypothetical protein